MAVCSGTSMAAPHVAAAAALIIARYPSWTNVQVRDRLLYTATDLGATGLDNTFGYGIVNVLKALQIQVEVVGPGTVYEGVEQEWGLAIYGGQSPFSYEWFVDGIPAGTGAALIYTPGSSSFSISVGVTDYLNQWTTAGKNVTVIQCDPWCA